MNEEEEKVEIEKPSKARGACVCARALLPTRERSLCVFFILSSSSYNIPFFFQRKKALTFFFEFFLSLFLCSFALTFSFSCDVND